MKYAYTKNRDSIISIGKRNQVKTPKPGWDAFLKEIFDLKILSLPDCRKIDGYGDCTDGYGITIEVATLKNYRIYNYECFGEYKELWQTKNIEKIMAIISSEFDFQWIRMSS